MELLASLVYEYADIDTQRNILNAYAIPVGTYRSLDSVERWTRARNHLEKELPKIRDRLQMYPDCSVVTLSNEYKIYHNPSVLTIGITCCPDRDVSREEIHDYYMIRKQKKIYYSATSILDSFIDYYSPDSPKRVLNAEECWKYLHPFLDERYAPIWLKRLDAEMVWLKKLKKKYEMGVQNFRETFCKMKFEDLIEHEKLYQYIQSYMESQHVGEERM